MLKGYKINYVSQAQHHFFQPPPHTIFSSPVESLCHTSGVVRSVSSVSIITTRNN